jgi:hypothetical protein
MGPFLVGGVVARVIDWSVNQFKDAHGAAHLFVLGRSRAYARHAPCVLDLLGHAHP